VEGDIRDRRGTQKRRAFLDDRERGVFPGAQRNVVVLDSAYFYYQLLSKD
jgi:hypothetical protein